MGCLSGCSETPRDDLADQIRKIVLAELRLYGLIGRGSVDADRRDRLVVILA